MKGEKPMPDNHCPECGRAWPQQLYYVSNVGDLRCKTCKAEKMRLRTIDFEAHEADLIARTEALKQGMPEEIRERGRQDAADLWG